MGLDIALGLMVLLGAIRGWFRGFLTQAVRLGGLVGCVYAAGPVRDLARPKVAPYLVSIRPDLLDRMLWWGSAAVCYVAVVGVAGLVIKAHRRRPYGEPEPNRADQLAGFLLSAAKGAVMAAFLVGTLDRNAPTLIKYVPGADEQARTSRALAWNAQYRPADRIWAAPPVQQFVAQVRKMGVDAPGTTSTDPAADEAPAQAAATRSPRLDLPIGPSTAADLAEAVDRALGPDPR